MIEQPKFFLGLPERWMDANLWRCANGHVSKRYLKTEGGCICLAGIGATGVATVGCQSTVILTFPEDHEGSELGAEVYALRMKQAELEAKARGMNEGGEPAPPVDEFMTPEDLTAAADTIRKQVPWAKLPKLAAIFEHRLSSNRYWHELVALSLLTLEHGPRQWTKRIIDTAGVIDAAIAWVQAELLASGEAHRSKLFRALVAGGFIDENGEKL